MATALKFKSFPPVRGLITGITRVSKESIFSDFNNLEVVSITSDKYMTSFGFTEEEVFDALEHAGMGKERQNVKKWYNGFTFGTHSDIYNPWSIVSLIGKNGKYDTYWSNTSGNGLVNSLIQSGDFRVKGAMEDLLQGIPLRVELNEQIIFNQLYNNDRAVWSLLLATGYLRVQNMEYIGEFKKKVYTLSLTNMEIHSMFETMVRGWFDGNTRIYYNEFIHSLLNDNVRKMNTFINKVALNTFSFFDSSNKPSDQTEPERFYHGFVLGMVVDLSDRYRIRSNRESGYGRYDVMMESLDKTGKAFIFKFKVLDPEVWICIQGEGMFDWMILPGAGYACIASPGVTGQRLKTLASTFTVFYFKNHFLLDRNRSQSIHEKTRINI